MTCKKLLEARQARCPSRMQKRPPRDAGEAGERGRGVRGRKGNSE